MPAATRVSYTETVWNTTAATKATASVSWLAGDLIVVLGATSDQQTTISGVTATGLTLTAGTPLTTANSAWANTWTATAGANGSSTFTATRAGVTSQHFGIGVWVFRAHGGAGNRGTNTSTAKTLSLTRAGANSRVVCGLFDWSAAAITSRVWTPAGQTEDEATVSAGLYTAFVADWPDQGATGTTSYGISGTASTGAHTKVALEILGTAGATTHVGAASGSSSSTGSAAVTLQLAAAASGASTSTGLAAAGLRMSAAASGASASTGAAAAAIASGAVTHQAAATGAATSAGSAAPALRLAAGASGASVSTGSAAATVVPAGPVTYQAAASGSSTSGGSAVLALRITLTASGASASTGSATPAALLAAAASGGGTSSGSAVAVVLGQLVTRPSTGTTTRPASGVTARPSTGITTRTSSGTTARPYAGVTRP